MAAAKPQYPSFTEYLPFRYFDSKTGLFINRQSIGFALEVPPYNGADESAVTSLNNFLVDKIPDAQESEGSFFSKVGKLFSGFDFGVYLYGSDKIAGSLQGLDQRDDDIFGKVNQISRAFLEHSCLHGVKNKLGLNMRLRDHRCFIFVSTPAKRYTQGVADNLLSLRADTLNAFTHSRILDDEAFLTIARTWLNPDTATGYERVDVDKTLTLDEQTLDLGFELNADNPDRLIIGHNKCDHHQSTQSTLVNLSLEQLPAEFALWQMPDSYFNLRYPQSAIACPFLISLHFRLEPYEKSKAKAHKKFISNDKMANSPMGKIFTSFKHQAQDWEGVREGLDAKQFKLAQAFYNVLLFSKEDRYKIDTDLAIDAFQRNGIKLKVQKRTQQQSLTSIIPFNISEGCFEDLRLYKRLRTLTSINVADLLPIIADPAGASQGAFFSTYRNQCFLLDPFELAGTSNANIAIAGFSGGGKSFLIQHIIYRIIATGGTVFIIDVGDSYKKLTQLLSRYMKATYINVGTLKMNPFSHLDNKEVFFQYHEQIVGLLAIMIEPRGELSQTVTVALSQAIENTFDQYGQDSQIDHVIDRLKQIAKEQKHSSNEIEACAYKLSDYASNTSKGKFFDGVSQFDPEARLVVLEMGAFDAKPALKSVVLYSMIMNINQRVYACKRSTDKVCLIDEAWRLLKSNNRSAISFIENGFRTIRKFGGLFCTVVQSPSDYIDNPMAKAIWDNSTFKLILRPDPTAFSDFVKEHPLIFSPTEVQMIRNFGEARQQGFSSALLKYKQCSFYLRLIVDPFSRVLFSTDPVEFDAVEALIAQGNKLEDAVMMVAKSRYGQECEEIGL